MTMADRPGVLMMGCPKSRDKRPIRDLETQCPTSANANANANVECQLLIANC